MDLDTLLPKLDRFREDAATLLADLDKTFGPGTPGALHRFLSMYSAALIAFRMATVEKPPRWGTSGMVTSRDIL